MTKISLTNLANMNNETTVIGLINTNNNTIEDESDQFLSRDGTEPNSMLANLDMNSYRIINLQAPVGETEPLRLGDIADIEAGTYTVGGMVGVYYFETRTLAVAATIPGTINMVITGGYAAAGDLGAARYKRITALTTADCGFTSADGAHWEICEPVLRPEMFSSTANTTAIQKAIDVANNQTFVGEVRLAAKKYDAVVQSGQDYCLKLYGSVSLIGEGGIGIRTSFGNVYDPGTVIRWGSGVANTKDIILWTNSSVVGAYGNTLGQRIQGIAFLPDGFTGTGAVSAPYYARDIIRVEAAAGLLLSLCAIEECTFGTCNGYSINFSSTTGDWGNGRIVNNTIWGGIKALAWYDNCLVRGNAFNGITECMNIKCVAGAGNLIIEHNNGINTGGAMTIKSGYGTKIHNNYFELPSAYTGSTGYYFNIDGSTSTSQDDLSFKNNICVQLGAFGLTGLVYFNNTRWAEIDDNYMRNDALPAIAGITVTSSNLQPYIGKNAVSETPSKLTPTTGNRLGVTVASPATVLPYGYDIPLTLGSNSWVAFSSTDTPSVRLSKDGMATITGAVKDGTTTSGLQIATIPAGCRPQGDIFRPVMLATGAPIGIKITASTGAVTLVGVGNATYTSLACSYPVSVA